MEQPLSVLVSVDKAGRYELVVPFVETRIHGDASPSRLYDDVALHLMERAYDSPQDELPRYLACPDTILRRIKVDLRFGDEATFRGRLSVVLRRWPDAPFYEATIPRFGLEQFIVRRPADLQTALPEALRRWSGGRLATIEARLERALARPTEYLDLLEVDFELPSVLPKTIRRQRITRDVEEDERLRRKRRRETPPTVLRQVGENLVHRALDGHLQKTVGREALVREAIGRMERPGAALLLVGPSGAGKSAILEHAIAELATSESRLQLRRDFWRVDAHRIIAGMRYVGQWEARCAAMVDELSARGDVLVVDDLPSLVFAGRTSHEKTNVAQFLEPHLAAGEIRIVGECTAGRLEAIRDENPGFFARFHVLRVPALDEATTLRVLLARLRWAEARALDRGRHSEGRSAAYLKVALDVPEALLSLTRRFYARRPLPGVAVRLFDQLVGESPSDRRDEEGRRILDRISLIELFARQTGLPRFVLWEAEGRSHRDTLEHFERRIIAQPEASRAAAEVITTLSQGLNDPSKPIASFLLVGPTGVGKTETAKAIAHYLFGSTERMVRFDMSELSDMDGPARLFGDVRRPDGELTRRVRQQPFSVVLLDEIEKAHASVFDTLLQVLGEGRLTSADGRTTDFCNTIILMTSNLGAREGESLLGFEGRTPRERSQHYLSAARAFFRPELFNRIDRIVAYAPLSPAASRPLVTRAVERLLARRGLQRAGVLVEIEEALIELLAREGFDARYGARSLQRAVEERLAVPLARSLVRSKTTEESVLVRLYRYGDAAGIDAVPLEEAAPVKASKPPTASSFAELDALHREAVAWIASAELTILARARELQSFALRHASEAETMRRDRPRRPAERQPDERQALEAETVEELQEAQGSLPVRYEVATSVCAELDALRLELERFADEELGGAFETRVVLGHRYQAEWEPMPRVYTVVEETPLPARSGLPPPGLVRLLLDLRDRIAEALERASQLDGVIETKILRVLPVTSDAQTSSFVRDLTAAYAQTLSSRGQLRVFACRERQWSLIAQRADGAFSELDADAPETDAPKTDAPVAFAIAIRGLGISEELRAEQGFQIDSQIRGPDVLTALVRIDLLEAEGDPIDVLTDLDQRYESFLKARREGVEVQTPRPRLPVRRRFEAGQAIDSSSGVAIRRDHLVEGLLRARIQRAVARRKER